jgi:glycosyltransferase involved in cell wall biosynthesis
VTNSVRPTVTSRPRAVLVTHVPPEAPWSGERRRVAATYSYLSGRYRCDIAICPRSDSALRRLRQKVARPFAPPYAAKFRRPDVDLDSYEVIWVFELWALSCVPVRMWHRVLWDKDTMMSDSYRGARRFRTRVIGYWTWWYERRAVSRVRHAFVSFADDVARFNAGHVSALPNGCVLPPRCGVGTSIESPAQDDVPRLGFVGLLAHEPNRRALMAFATEVLPNLREEPALAEIELWVAGAYLAERDAIRLRAISGVVILGYVPQIADFYAAVNLAIAPLGDGAGTPTKVIEALGHGVPVIGTQQALRGLDDNLRQWCVEVGDSGWPSAVQTGLRLRRDQSLPVCEVHRCYSWPAVFERTLEPLFGSAND